VKTVRLYPEDWQGKHYFYVAVKVFDTRKEMSESITEYMQEPADGACEGQCSGHARYDKRGKLTGNFATMWLNVDDLRNHAAEIISHECTHAAMRHLHNKSVDLSDIGGEEALCYCVGSMTQQLTDKLYKLKVFNNA